MLLPPFMHGRVHVISAPSARSIDVQEPKFLLSLIDDVRNEKLLPPSKSGVTCGFDPKERYLRGDLPNPKDLLAPINNGKEDVDINHVRCLFGC